MSVESFRGPIRNIRATADGAKNLGDWEKIGGVFGFWLHDTPDKAIGSFCIGAALVEVSRKAENMGKDLRIAAVKAGTVLTCNASDKFEEGKAGADRNLPGAVGIVYQDAADDQPVHIILGQH